MKVRNYTELIVWQKGMDLVEAMYAASAGFPPAEVYGLPDPFAPLPICPAGQLQNEQGLPITKEDVEKLKREGRWSYPIAILWDGILVDDPGHPLDHEARIHQVLQTIWKDNWEVVKNEVCEFLGVRALRDYFRKPGGFFADHLKRYSKSRRKAPIYWPLSMASGDYSVWLYYHRFTPDTFYKVLNDYVKPKVEHESRKLDHLQAESGADPTRSQRSELDAQQVFVAELKAFQEEIERIAPLWNPDLNDGVIINFAPLWRLVPQHRAWQKECKECWDSLVAGEYDWSHLAMHLWPERVVPKCADDRSLAIAHDLEEVFWEPDKGSGQGSVGSGQKEKKRGRRRAGEAMLIANGESDEGASEDSGDSSPATDHSLPSTTRTKWRKKKVTKEQIQVLIAERTKPAVKAALENLLSAPTPGSNDKHRRRTTR